MKKFVYFCLFILIIPKMEAQVDLYDGTWFPSFEYSFSNPNFAWNNTTWCSNDNVWKAYLHNVSHGHGDLKELQIYQVSNCQFDSNNNYMVFKSEYDNLGKIPYHHYQLPSALNGVWPNQYGQRDSLYFFSGEMVMDTCQFRYGYFEIRCKLPIHKGAFPAFWLWHNTSNYYNEIDIFEFNWTFEDPSQWSQHHTQHGAGNPMCFSTGIYFNDITSFPYSFARNYPMINDSLSHWHTFACEWMPDYVKWYCDGAVVNDFHDREHVPNQLLSLIVNYAIDKNAFYGHTFGNNLEWTGNGEMVIDYVKVNQLQWDCQNEEVIACQLDLDLFDYKVKKSVEISTSGQAIQMSTGDKYTFRVTDDFQVTGPFEVEVGGEMNVVLQACPDDY